MKKACVVWMVLCGFGAAPAWADGAWGEPALRLPGEAGAVQGRPASLPAVRPWAGDVSDRLARLGRSPMTGLRWRADGAQPARRQLTDQPLMLERTRTALTAHWQPWALGAWKLGASMGLSKVLPSSPSGTRAFVAMPMASYEQPGYRVNLGLMAPRGSRESALLLGLSVPLH